MEVYAVPMAIIIGSLIVAQQMHWGFEAHAKLKDKQTAELRIIEGELKRIGDKLDALWSAIKGINNLAWRQSGINPDAD